MSETTREAYREEIERLAAQLTIADAHISALAAALSELIAYVRNVGGFMFAEEQATLRHAMAVLAEVQRR